MKTVEFEVAFSKLPPSKQVRFEDRVSFLYLEYRKVIQGEFGVIALGTNEEGEFVTEKLQIPVGGLAVLALGPGTSITNAAITSATRYGCTVIFTTGGALSANSIISPLTGSSKWAIAQAKVVSDAALARKVAKKFYAKQFRLESFAGSIAQMRAIEGSLMKKTYAAEAKKNRVAKFRRDTKSEDNVNVALNIANGIMYGISAAAVGTLGMNQGLGVIHRGNASAFLFDIADFYKPQLVIPLAFRLHDAPPEDVPKLIRRSLRSALHHGNVLSDIIDTLRDTFSEYLPSNTEDRLIGLQTEVVGHVNYANYRGNSQLNRIESETDAISDSDD